MSEGDKRTRPRQRTERYAPRATGLQTRFRTQREALAVRGLSFGWSVLALGRGGWLACGLPTVGYGLLSLCYPSHALPHLNTASTEPPWHRSGERQVPGGLGSRRPMIALLVPSATHERALRRHLHRQWLLAPDDCSAALEIAWSSKPPLMFGRVCPHAGQVVPLCARIAGRI